MTMLPAHDAVDPAELKARAEAIRKDPDLIGEQAYEAHRALLPLYHDGTPRPTWDKLQPIFKWSWSRPGKP